MVEIYKDIKGYEGIYQVSNLGNVKSLERMVARGNSFMKVRERILKPRIGSSGFEAVALSMNGIQGNDRVHQLVAVAFLKHKLCGHELVVKHIDSNKLNNNVSNLEIVTSIRDTMKKHKTSSSKYMGVHFVAARKKWQATIHVNGKSKYLGYFKTELEASKVYQKALITIK